MVVDGRFDEWVEIEWFPVSEVLPEVSHTRFSQLEDDGSTEPAGTARTAADLSGLFAMQWDEKCLYLAAKVTDNVHVVGKAGGESGWYTRDGVSLFLDVPNDGDGHGMEAAIPTVLFSGILDRQMENATTPEKLFPRLNRSLYRTVVCFSMGELDPSSRRLRLVNGGCPYPYHYRSSTETVEDCTWMRFRWAFVRRRNTAW